MKEKFKLFYPLTALGLIWVYTYLPWKIPNSPLWGNISILDSYIIGTIACAIVAILAIILLYKMGNWQKINSKKWRWSYLGYAFLTIFSTYAWNVVARFFLPPT